MKFNRGDRVRKIKGYKFEGVVLGSFAKRDEVTVFSNVEHDDGWVMHFRENELELVNPSDGEGK